MRTEANKYERSECLFAVIEQAKRDFANGNLRDFRESLMSLEKQDIPLVVLSLSADIKSGLFAQFLILAEL